jgi:hypothetical protein
MDRNRVPRSTGIAETFIQLTFLISSPSLSLTFQKDLDSGEGSKIETMRKVSCIRITLSKNSATKGHSDADGYQPPLPAHMVTDAPGQSASAAAARPPSGRLPADAGGPPQSSGQQRGAAPSRRQQGGGSAQPPGPRGVERPRSAAVPAATAR